jgi:hypothetical protein
MKFGPQAAFSSIGAAGELIFLDIDEGEEIYCGF